MTETPLPRSPVSPPGWEVVPETPPGVVWAAREPARPDRAGAFRANLVLTTDDTGSLSFRDWQVGTDELLPRQLDDYLLVDLERLDIDGHPGGRRLAHHAGPDGAALTMEQWFVLADGRGHTLTATVETWGYDELADLFAEVAASWRPLTGTDADAG